MTSHTQLKQCVFKIQNIEHNVFNVQNTKSISKKYFTNLINKKTRIKHTLSMIHKFVDSKSGG